MRRFIYQALGTYRQHVAEIAAVTVVLLAALIIQLSRDAEADNWPQSWDFHGRITLGRINHGQPEILFFHPNGAWVHVPYLSGVFEKLKTNDSISKAIATKRLYVIRDSAAYRFTTQWAWNETTRRFEPAGRITSKR